MIGTKTNISNLNINNLLTETNTTSATVNNIRLINDASSSQKVSVVCHPITDSTSYYTLDNNLSPCQKQSCSSNKDQPDSYYGLNPMFGADRCIEILNNKEVMDTSSFQKLLSQNGDSFCMHKDDTEYMAGLFAKVIVTMASNFCLKFKCNYNTKVKLETLIEHSIHINSQSPFKQGITYDIITHNSDDELPHTFMIIGFLLKEQAEILHNFNINPTNSSIEYAPNGGNFYDELKNSSNRFLYSLRNLSNVYYSGVMPRVVNISINNNHTMTSNVKHISLCVERTTYATVQAFDNTSMDVHPLLSSSKKQISAFYAKEDHAQSFLHQVDISAVNSSSDYEDMHVKQINKYLSQSPNTHTIAVLGFINTSDNYWIYPRRSNFSIDGGEYYCSVNGQSEFLDPNVDMYKNSVLDDLPTMEFNDKIRISFENELNRETTAELGMVSLQNEWEYLGLSYLSINNEGRFPTKRRMHFNVVAVNAISNSLEEVIDLQQSATEQFESDKFIGVKFNKYNSRLDYICSYPLSFFKLVLNQRELILAISFLIYFTGNIDFSNLKSMFININDSTTYIIMFLLLTFTIRDVCININHYFKLKNTKHKITLISNRHDDNDITNYIKKKYISFIGSNKLKFSAVGRLMYFITLKKF